MKTNAKASAISVLLSCVAAFHTLASDELHSSVQLGQGYRHDRLKYSFAGTHRHPNIISELDFKNLRVYLTTLKASLSNDTYIGVVEAAYGAIIHGNARESDYFKENRHGVFSRSISNVHGDHTIDCSAKIGRIFPIFSEVTFTPSIGYGAFWQRLRIHHVHHTIPRGHIGEQQERDLRRLVSTYSTFWGAPFVEARLSAPLKSDLTLDLGYTFFYPIRYIGKGNWNLRRLHFTHKNQIEKSYGQKGDISLRWAYTKRLEYGLTVGIARFTARDGHVTFKQSGVAGHLPAHRATRTFVDYLVTLSYAF